MKALDIQVHEKKRKYSGKCATTYALEEQKSCIETTGFMLKVHSSPKSCEADYHKVLLHVYDSDIRLISTSNPDRNTRYSKHVILYTCNVNAGTEIAIRPRLPCPNRRS
jgi:hypothetical protein